MPEIVYFCYDKHLRIHRKTIDVTGKSKAEITEIMDNIATNVEMANYSVWKDKFNLKVLDNASP